MIVDNDTRRGETDAFRPSFQADATTSDPRPEGLGYSVRPFHGRCGPWRLAEYSNSSQD
jgi:hypothetical protein